MHIVKPTEPILVEHPVFLVIGQPGIGKTTLGNSCAEPLIFDYDLGAHRASNRRDTVQITSQADAAEARAALDPYKSVVVDTVGRCLDIMTVDLIAANPKLGPNGNLSQQGWGRLKSNFKLGITELRAQGKDVLLLAHDKEERDGDVRLIRADIQGGSLGEVMKTADFVGYLYMVGRQRVLDFSPTDTRHGKNPAQWSPFKVPPADKMGSFMADLFVKGREALGKISAANAVAVSAVDEWRLSISSLTNALEFTLHLNELNSKPFSAPIKAQVKKLMSERCKELGITYDKAKFCFVDPQHKPDHVFENELA